ncbi:Type 1 glutamine amidotransferase-like domain-containing protein [Kineococcus sp. SYSU DK002]|uniref:Type 1 glutamine amidotransferase-like domain-containing protein n=1 Tax=Kineococcus sp. SYSU DK002 TaxID=3383123 RepID=UPI003D7D9D96
MTGTYLGGGGSEHDEAALWDEVFTPGQRVSVWPFAMPLGPARTGSVQWLAGALRARGDFTLDPWGLDGADTDCRAERLHRSDVVAIPGGNTFDLLHHLQRHDLLSALDGFLDRGGRVYGGSAGAVLLGANIALAEVEDPDDAGVSDTRGLDRLAGAVVRPHYQPAQDDDLQQWAEAHQQVVLALPERSGVVVTGATARNVGPEAVQVFSPSGQRARPAGTTWDLRASRGHGAPRTVPGSAPPPHSSLVDPPRSR